MVDRFEIVPLGSFSLVSSARAFESFAPATYGGMEEDLLRFAFVADGLADGDRVAGVLVRQENDAVIGEVYGDADVEVVKRQVARILLLDVDGRGFPEVAERDPVVGGLQGRYTGLRPVCFFSPYEAAAWAIMGNRIRLAQAAKIRARMAEEMGQEVKMGDRVGHAFPGPSRLEKLETFPGLSGTKIERLRHLARAAGEGKLEADFLRSLPIEESLSRLRELPGIGPFSAELILLRGVGEPDYLSTRAPRLDLAVAKAYGLEETPNAEELEEIAEKWRPYRSWVALHMRAVLEHESD